MHPQFYNLEINIAPISLHNWMIKKQESIEVIHLSHDHFRCLTIQYSYAFVLDDDSNIYIVMWPLFIRSFVFFIHIGYLKTIDAEQRI